jgi:hypothetical protein
MVLEFKKVPKKHLIISFKQLKLIFQQLKIKLVIVILAVMELKWIDN